jgi:predicted SAM-dependent methyltransferase
LLNLGCGSSFHPDWVNVDFGVHAPGVIRHDLRRPLPFPDASFTAVYHSHVLEHLSRDCAPLFLQECRRVLRPDGILRAVVPDLETIARLYLQALEGAVSGDGAAAARHEWMTIELLDQMVREESGGAMLEYWKQNPMPAEQFVLERHGQEVRAFLESFRSQPQPPRPRKPVDLGAWRPRRPSRVLKFLARGEVHKWMYDRHSLGALLKEAGFAQPRVCTAWESAIPGFAAYHLDATDGGGVRKPDSLFMEARSKAA